MSAYTRPSLFVVYLFVPKLLRAGIQERVMSVLHENDDVAVGTSWMHAGEMQLEALVETGASTPGDFDEAVLKLENARDLFFRARNYGQLAPCLVLLGKTYRRAGRVDAAQEAFQTAVGMCMTEGATGPLTTAYLCLGSLHQSLAYEASGKEDVTGASTLWNRARHDFEAALRLMEAYREAPSRVLSVLFKLGNACLWLHMYHEAAEIFNVAVKMCENNPDDPLCQVFAKDARSCADAFKDLQAVEPSVSSL